MRMSARAAFKEKISFMKILAGNKVRDRFFVVYNIIAEDIFQFILYSYFTSHKTIISEISRILNPAFFMRK